MPSCLKRRTLASTARATGLVFSKATRDCRSNVYVYSWPVVSAAAAGALGPLARDEGFEVELGCLRHVRLQGSVVEPKHAGLDPQFARTRGARVGLARGAATGPSARHWPFSPPLTKRVSVGAASSAPEAAIADAGRDGDARARKDPRGPRGPAPVVMLVGRDVARGGRPGLDVAPHEQSIATGALAGGDPERSGRWPASDADPAGRIGPARRCNASPASVRARRPRSSRGPAPARRSTRSSCLAAPRSIRPRRTHRPRTRRERAGRRVSRAGPWRRRSLRRAGSASSSGTSIATCASAGWDAALVSPRPGIRPPSSVSARNPLAVGCFRIRGVDASPARRSRALEPRP